MRWELEEIKSSKYLLFLGPPRPRSCYIGSYWQLKEGRSFSSCAIATGKSVVLQ